MIYRVRDQITYSSAKMPGEPQFYFFGKVGVLNGSVSIVLQLISYPGAVPATQIPGYGFCPVNGGRDMPTPRPIPRPHFDHGKAQVVMVRARNRRLERRPLAFARLRSTRPLEVMVSTDCLARYNPGYSDSHGRGIFCVSPSLPKTFHDTER